MKLPECAAASNRKDRLSWALQLEEDEVRGVEHDELAVVRVVVAAADGVCVR